MCTESAIADEDVEPVETTETLRLTLPGLRRHAARDARAHGPLTLGHLSPSAPAPGIPATDSVDLSEDPCMEIERPPALDPSPDPSPDADLRDSRSRPLTNARTSAPAHRRRG